MKLWPFVSRAEHEAVLADRERIRSERNQFAKDCKAQHAAARTAARQFTSVDEELAETRIVNARLTEQLTETRKKLAESIAVEGALAKQIHAMAQPVELTDAELDEINQLIHERDAEKKRADGLQQQMDTFLGLDVAAVAEGAGWQGRREQRMRYDKPAAEEENAS